MVTDSGRCAGRLRVVNLAHAKGMNRYDPLEAGDQWAKTAMQEPALEQIRRSSMRGEMR